MTTFTLKQAAILVVRFFGFYLLFVLPFNLTELPAYWLRSSLSPLHPTNRSVYEASYDVSLVMFCARQAGYLVFGAFFFRRPDKLAALLLRFFGEEPPQTPA